MNLFINCSNHPAHGWGHAQRDAAEALGQIVEVPFPWVPPDLLAGGVSAMAYELYEQFLRLASPYEKTTIHLMGETSLVTSVLDHHLVTHAEPHEEITFVVSTSRREAVEREGSTRWQYSWVSFRPVPCHAWLDERYTGASERRTHADQS
ncbi:CRISPR-associated protein [uncultured Mediterranean phage uvDeep-CGR2-KM21-C338]|nr:CRISPR-associated protein [uncultured Mediterranean phage uvDeep-CGR2-KM21-C338]